MNFIERNCIKNPLINVTPSNIDNLYLKEMRKFIYLNLKENLQKYIFENCKIGYVGLTGYKLNELVDINFKLFTLDIDKDNNPDFLIDLTKDNSNVIADKFFDILICTEVLEHTENPINCIYELNRMLKNNGKLIISTPYNFRIHGPLPDNFRITEWFYKEHLKKLNYNILSFKALEDSERKLCPIDYFICAEKYNKTKLKGIVFPSGSGVSIEIYEALKNHKDIDLLFINSVEVSQTSNLFKSKYVDAPSLNNRTEDIFIKYINNIINIEKVDFIIPTMDKAHYFLSKNKDSLLCKVITSHFETNKICINKENTYNYLNSIIKCPKIFEIHSNIEFPVFIKPKEGYSSQNCFKINNIEELNFYYNKNMLITEYLPGDEYTIDCFTNNNKLLYIFPRKRKLTKNGLSIITENINKNSDLFQMFLSYATQINNSLVFTGSWFFQIKMDNNGDITLLEISTRIAGASAINRINNVNLPLLSIYAVFNYPIKILENDLNRYTITKTYKSIICDNFMDNIDNIYIDLDDTLIINNNINYECISLIYKYINDKDIFLITRHKDNIYKTLKNNHIHIDLFSSIIHIKNNDNKYTYIKNNSLFFDDSFKERSSVINKENNIQVFDIDCISFFL